MEGCRRACLSALLTDRLVRVRLWFHQGASGRLDVLIGTAISVDLWFIVVILLTARRVSASPCRFVRSRPVDWM